MATRSFWSKLRLVLLTLLLVIVSLNTWLSRVRTTDWQEPLWVVIYPINADQRSDTQLYIDGLAEDHFDDIERFIDREASRYGIELDKPIEVYLSKPLMGRPPRPPENPSILDSVIWSLHLRYWSWKYDNWEGVTPDIRVYLRLYSPQNNQVLEHSLGLQKGMIGVVNGFASVDYQAQNNFVTVHEVLHTLGASDKYDFSNNQPHWPDGYADPYQVPLLPQYRAEVMGGRVPQDRYHSLIPTSLDQVVVGEKTAVEINWRPDFE
ncbi:hypothetical protein [uncultured Neptuniibacter sp.]|uniref:hypothetical protein n=1 Tax=uncultured Neptuniibacter sp. TaxID=502143 RepID=UPI0026275B5E|nr:hypothetical protein [uncultured Neptuniibacter sp.]